VRPEQLGQVVFGAWTASTRRARRRLRPYWGDVVLCEGEDDGVLDLRIGVGVAPPFPGLGRWRPWKTPGGEAVQVTHLGAYSERAGARGGEGRRARLGRRLTGVHWEVYGAFDLRPAPADRRLLRGGR
jgi:hypothetical protein